MLPKPEGAPVFHVTVMPDVEDAVHELLPDVEDRLRVWNRLYDQLENNAAPYRRIRDMDEPDFLFDYVHVLYAGGRWLTLRFSVNDTTAAGQLFVEAVSWR
jgi:citrate lyase beta subunit